MGKCGNFFGMVLPSSSLLILDFIYAANTIIDSANTAVSLIINKFWNNELRRRLLARTCSDSENFFKTVVNFSGGVIMLYCY